MECMPSHSREFTVTQGMTSPLQEGAIRNAAALLGHAKHPVLLAGGGAVWADTSTEVRQLAQRLNCPVLTSLNGKGILDEREPHALGHARTPASKAALAQADVMLAIGCRFTEVMTGFRKLRVPTQLIQIDIDASQIGMNHPVAIGIHADAKEALQALLTALPSRPSSDWPVATAAVRPRSEWLIDRKSVV